MGKLGGAPHKLENLIQFHLGDTITALSRAVMQPGGGEVLLYATISGGVGTFSPFQSKEVRNSCEVLGGAQEFVAFRSASGTAAVLVAMCVAWG
jgi:hypothetical protein